MVVVWVRVGVGEDIKRRKHTGRARVRSPRCRGGIVYKVERDFDGVKNNSNTFPKWCRWGVGKVKGWVRG